MPKPIEVAHSTCGQCRHYVRDEEGTGECHRNPPQVLQSQGEVFCARPFPAETERSCGEFSPRLQS